MNVFNDLEVLQIHQPQAAAPCHYAVHFLGQLAVKCGASVTVTPSDAKHSPESHNRGKTQATIDNPLAWAAQSPQTRVLIVAGEETASHHDAANASAVIFTMNNQHTEATLFAESGLADLLGDNQREPLIPNGHFAAGTIAYAGFTALSALYSKQQAGATDVAVIHGLTAMAWVNWKAIAAGLLGRDIHREGKQAEWPVLPCKDGYVALVYTERDWPQLVNMVGDDRLHRPEFADFKQRDANRDAYIDIIKTWLLSKTKSEFSQLCFEYAIPGSAVCNLDDVLSDPLLEHRQAFYIDTNAHGETVKVTQHPHRIARLAANPGTPQRCAALNQQDLPLKGVRILDLGIITAGAGTTGLLADMGAEILKIESATYPDPFRQWAGSDDSPLFHFTNRNKYGVGIDLKTDAGIEQFKTLVRSADVVVENFRRGVLDRMGFDFDTLKAINPTLVLASISGQGLTGPMSEHTTFGSTLEASSGFAAQTCYPHEAPTITGRNVNYPDQTVCLYAAGAINAAIVQAKRQNSAIHIDIAQRDVAMVILSEELEAVSAKHNITPPPQQVFACKDGRYLAINLTATLPVATADLADWLCQRDSDTAIANIIENGGFAVKCMYGSELLKHPEIKANEAVTKDPNGAWVKGYAFQLTNSPLKIHLGSPKVGQHTAQFIEAAN